MIGLDKILPVVLACLALWAEARLDDDFSEPAEQLELYRLGGVSSLPVVSSSLSKPTRFRRPTTTRRPFRKRPTTTQRPPQTLPVEAPAALPALQPSPEVVPVVPESVPEDETQQPQVSDSQPPFDNSPYQPPIPPPAPPAVSTANLAVVQAPPGRPQRPLPPPKPFRPQGRPPVAVQPAVRPPVDLTVPDEQPALVYSESSVDGDGGYSFSFQVTNSIFRKEQGFMKRSITAPGHLVHVKTGAYSFTSPDGTFHRIDFIADENGYRAYESS